MYLEPEGYYDIVSYRPADRRLMKVQKTISLRLAHRPTGNRARVNLKLTELDPRTGEFEGVTIHQDPHTRSQRLGGSFTNNGCPELRVIKPGSGD